MPAVGAEINPAACKMAQIYCLINVPISKRRSLTTRLEKVLQERLPQREPSLFTTNGDGEDKGIKESLVEIHRGLNDHAAHQFSRLIVLVDFYQDVTEQRVFDTWARLRRGS